MHFMSVHLSIYLFVLRTFIWFWSCTDDFNDELCADRAVSLELLLHTVCRSITEYDWTSTAVLLLQLQIKSGCGCITDIQCSSPMHKTSLIDIDEITSSSNFIWR